MRLRLCIAGAVALSAGSAWADHDHAVEHAHASAFGAGVTMVAASYDSMFFVGNYQGVQPAVTWGNPRFAAGVSGALYRIERNGASYYGFGDLVAHGQAMLAGDERVRGGFVLGVTAPVGDERHGLGMGHPMVMPAAYGTLALDEVVVTATAGYSRAVASDSDHDHRMWLLVEPMNISELTWSASSEYAINPALHASARASGGIPIGNGDTRVVGAVRVGWQTGRFATAGELQAGLVGDPFNVRGLVSTTMSF
jgi:hypothetical protein